MELIEDIAVVREVKDGKARVQLPETGNCKSCVMNGVCRQGHQLKSHWIETDIELKPGDLVRIFVAPALRIASSFIIFLLPIFVMLAVYLVFKYLFLSSENIAIMSSILSLGLSAFIIYLLDKIWGKKIKFEILEKLNETKLQEELIDEDTLE
jgi:positive regulator of sigma E activity